MLIIVALEQSIRLIKSLAHYWIAVKSKTTSFQKWSVQNKVENITVYGPGFVWIASRSGLASSKGSGEGAEKGTEVHQRSAVSPVHFFPKKDWVGSDLPVCKRCDWKGNNVPRRSWNALSSCSWLWVNGIKWGKQELEQMEEGTCLCVRKLRHRIPCHRVLYSVSIYWFERNLDKFKEDI